MDKTQSENMITALALHKACQAKINLLTTYIAELIEVKKANFDQAVYLAIKKYGQPGANVI